MTLRSASDLIVGIALLGIAGCGGIDNGDNSDSEVAVSLVSGALNNESGTTVGWNLPRQKKSLVDHAIDGLSFVSVAHAASWSCSGATLSPTFSGPAGNPYTYTPVSCTVTWGAGNTASSKWSSTFSVTYGASCDTTHARVVEQAGGCTITRTTAAGGNTRTITGPDGNSYAITHDTQGAGSGWDSTVTPAPSNAGVSVTCAPGGCKSGGTLVVNGSHLLGTITNNGKATKIWDHTISTLDGGLTLAVNGDERVLDGAVSVQHNLAKYTATASFDKVTYGQPGCCFPTSGSITTTFDGGADKGRSESLQFSSVCGEATYTGPRGRSGSVTLQHCL